MTEAQGAIRVLVCDDHDLVRRGLLSYLDTEAGIEVVGEAASGEEAVASAASLRPDVVLMDLLMPGMGGVEATRALAAVAPHSKVVILTSVVTDEQVLPALEAGALSYLLKSASAHEVVAAIRAAAFGQATLDRNVAASVVRAVRQPAARSGPGEFTPREREVLLEVARGKSNQEIADVLGIGIKTVKTHVSSLLSKLALYDRTQLAVYAHTHGMMREG